MCQGEVEALGRIKVHCIWPGVILVGWNIYRCVVSMHWWETSVPAKINWETTGRSHSCQEVLANQAQGRRGDGFIWMLLGLDTTWVHLCTQGFVCLVGRRAQDCPGTAEIPKSFVLGWIRDLKNSDMYFFNTHNSVVWCLVNSCLTAELTAVGFTHPLEMLKLEKKI